MYRCLLQCLSVLTLSLVVPVRLPAQQPAPTRASATGAASAEAEVRDAIRRYDVALKRADTAAAGQFWAPEYTFVNLRGERVTRAERIANLRTARTTFDSIAHAPEEEKIRIYGDDVAVYTTTLTLAGRYSGKAHQGRYRSLVVWVRRDGRWQQVASQMTPVLGP